ncbi:putative peptide maturation dehydrogenase [Xanthomonas campestris]|uniref:putative peptide maturation dehydrogenase n=1 Tax=Xanthomonas campestris TaxID=339 RepID=UPI001E51799B|nr:putative peptide maturation dehydrogenase [Xanthomonas campestris]MCC4603194.1 putative peptide maturation dehydrogenase [Xanthomonas campestris pv. parthenii]
MQVRRCRVVLLEPREVVEFELSALLAGGNGLRRQMAWFALAPHLDAELQLERPEYELLGTLSPTDWIDMTLLNAEPSVIQALMDAGLVLVRGDDANPHSVCDARLRAAHWHPLGAVLHTFTRWDGVDAVKNMRDSGTETAVQMREVLGAPPPEITPLSAGTSLVELPRADASDFDLLLSRRVTCRNFDSTQPLTLAKFSQVMQRVFASQAQMRVGGDLVFLKKSVPSGGGLHPIDAYLIVQHVEGIAAGLYHYRSDTHSLAPIDDAVEVNHQFVMESVGQQHWFADAHVLIALVPRFDRTFWKYRQHAKGYRVVAMEAGHLSQTLYLAATEQGLGAFITGAINEKHLERSFALDPAVQGVMAVCGFGLRADRMETAELDPAGIIWRLPDSEAG